MAFPFQQVGAGVKLTVATYPVALG